MRLFCLLFYRNRFLRRSIKGKKVIADYADFTDFPDTRLRIRNDEANRLTWILRKVKNMDSCFRRNDKVAGITVLVEMAIFWH